MACSFSDNFDPTGVQARRILGADDQTGPEAEFFIAPCDQSSSPKRVPKTSRCPSPPAQKNIITLANGVTANGFGEALAGKRCGGYENALGYVGGHRSTSIRPRPDGRPRLTMGDGDRRAAFGLMIILGIVIMVARANGQAGVGI
jgi:hypothetical protein